MMDYATIENVMIIYHCLHTIYIETIEKILKILMNIFGHVLPIQHYLDPGPLVFCVSFLMAVWTTAIVAVTGVCARFLF